MKSVAIVSAIMGVSLTGMVCVWPNKTLDAVALENIRGKNAYYQGSLARDAIDVTVRLKDTDKRVAFKTRVNFQYQLGLDCEGALEAVEKRRPYVEDALIMHFADFSREDLSGPAVRHRLRKEIAHIIESDLFPRGQARVREVLFPVWQFMSIPN